MKKGINLICSLALFAGFYSCRQNLHTAAYADYVQNEKNGLKKTIQLQQWEYTMQYKPVDYIILMENKGNNNSYVNRRKADLKGTIWFNISFKVGEGGMEPLRYALQTRADYDRRL